MSKTKLALAFFSVAFGINIFAFAFFKKNWVIEENKMIWLYELPASASPLDSGVATDFGPAQGIQGTLIRPGTGEPTTKVEGELAQTWTWDAVNHEFSFQLNPKLKYQDGSTIEAAHFVKAADYIKAELKPLQSLWSAPEWRWWMESTYRAINATTLNITFKTPAPNGVTPDVMIAKVFSNVLTGVIHPQNLTDLAQGKKITKDWISSGPYRVRKWNPKEVMIVSRDDFPAGMQEGFFRVLKYQSAPVINPAAHFLQAISAEKAISPEHSVQERALDLHVFWICRSWKEPGTFCTDAASREALAKVFSAQGDPSPTALAGKTVRYRIPVGSEPFREDFRKKIHDLVTKAGGTPKEVSFFFKNSNESDLELQFISVLKGSGTGFAEILSRRSGRMSHAAAEPYLVGEIAKFDLNVQWKGPNSKETYDIFKWVFLTPDMSMKKITF